MSPQLHLRADEMIASFVQVLLRQRGDGAGAGVAGADDHIQLRAKTEGLAFRFSVHSLGAAGDDQDIAHGRDVHFGCWCFESKGGEGHAAVGHREEEVWWKKGVAVFMQKTREARANGEVECGVT